MRYSRSAGAGSATCPDSLLLGGGGPSLAEFMEGLVPVIVGAVPGITSRGREYLLSGDFSASAWSGLSKSRTFITVGHRWPMCP
jgi:hypothetical protein